MTILSYKGYQGSIEYEDGQLIIQLLHIDDFITTTCDSAGQAETAFQELVDDYLVTCEETGRAPKKPYKGSLNIRMLPELHRHAAMAAASAGISLNAWIVRACEAAMSAPSRGVGAAVEILENKLPQSPGIESAWHEYLSDYAAEHFMGSCKTLWSYSPHSDKVWTNLMQFDPFQKSNPKLGTHWPIGGRTRLPERKR
jgi:predicted HicB family RNase H-like nuclease